MFLPDSISQSSVLREHEREREIIMQKGDFLPLRTCADEVIPWGEMRSLAVGGSVGHIND